MLDTVTIGTDAGWSWDEGAGADVQTVDALFTTRARIKSATLVRDAEGGGRTIAEVNRELHIPVDSPAVPAGAVAVVTAIGAGTDPTLLNARLRIEGQAPGSQTTARRLEVVEVIA